MTENLQLNEVRLDRDQRRTAEQLSDAVNENPLMAAFELIALRKVARLASELCTAVDRESDDIGGSRRSLDILQDLGPACDAVEGR